MSNQVEISNGIYVNRSENDKIHELTMLYLKNQNLSNVSVSELAKKYMDTKQNFEKAFEDIYSNDTYYV